MPIDTRVPGDPGAVRTAAAWLRDGLHTAVAAAADEAHRTRRDSEGVWSGGAGDAFRTRLGTAVGPADALGEDALGSARALERWAADLDSARAAMERARTLAVEAGLAVSGDVIEEPGLAPVAPAGTDPARASAAADVHAGRVTAWNAAVQQADEAHRILRAGGEVLRSYANEVVGKWHLNATDFANGVVGGLATQRRDALLARSAMLAAAAERARALYLSSPGGSAVARRAGEIEFVTGNRAAALAREADGWIGTVVRRAPGIGVAITAAGIGYDISQGKPPGKAIASGIVSGVAAFGAGALLAGAVVGAPVWVAAAGAVAVGVGVGMAVDWAYDEWVPQDVRDGIDNGIAAVGEGVGDAWDAVFG